MNDVLNERLKEIDLEKAKLHNKIDELRVEQMEILKSLEKV